MAGLRTVDAVIRACAGREATLLAPDRLATSGEELAAHARSTGGMLRAAGVARNDRVALVVENGPEAATAFLAVASAAVCAPLNPSYRAHELAFYLEDLGARAVLVSSTLDSPIRDVAQGTGIPVFELEHRPDEPAGLFRLGGAASAIDLDDPSPDAEALVLHTSGTTARPKIVPLAHRHLVASAFNVATALRLGPDDRCLNVMPLFHIHGLVAGVLASLAAQGSVACAPGFHQLRFFEWLRALEPTWTTAVPTMHQAILERAERDPTLVAEHRLRFVRSSSAALPVPVLEGLEQVLGVPVVEAYGMTEAAHQMASNALPPGTRKPGSVGRPAGPEIAVIDESGRLLGPAEVGEVSIRGDNVFLGYESNPDANVASFTDGWFRTGDQGYLDSDGYLFLQGRLKEVINRGGEKISPRELDEVLMRHPAVAQVVTFAMPHDRLGEEVAAAVVLRDDALVEERDLQDFVGQVVAPFKVPRRIVLVDEIPKGPTGKLQRIGLAERLSVAALPVLASERAPTLERLLQEVWSDVLETPGIGPLDDFFALGGDSILGAEAVARVRDLVGRPDLPLITIVRSPTPRAMAAEVQAGLGWDRSGVVEIQAGRAVRPLFLAHPGDGEVIGYAALARRLVGRPVYGLRAPGHDGAEPLPRDISMLADLFLPGIRAVQQHGPYLLGALCMGGTVVLELERRLAAEGESVGQVLIDPRIRRPDGLRYSLWLAPRRVRQRRLGSAVLRRLRGQPRPIGELGPDAPVLQHALEVARETYRCAPTSAPTALVHSGDFARYELPAWYLRSIFRNVVSVERVSYPHEQVLKPGSLDSVVPAVQRAIDTVEAILGSRS